MNGTATSPVRLRPSWWSVIVFGQPWFVAGLLLLAGAAASEHLLGTPLPRLHAPALWLLALAAVQGSIRRACRIYTVGPTHARVQAGVLARVDSSLPLEAISQTTRTSSLFERLVGAGTISLGGNDGPLLRFRFIPQADRNLSAIRALVGSARMPHARPIPVIGLSGGIGAGKSTVAKAFAAQNCLVIDADADARAALTLPHVREKLLQWWGPTILASDGQIDRKAVASIVFTRPEERQRLESLVHPIIRADRTQLINRAAAEGRIAAVIDAPLLFEAGTDSECDVLLFVETPRETRIARVAASRGWDEAELTRREASQLPLEEKRRRSHRVIHNNGQPEELAKQVRSVLDSRIVRGPSQITGLPEAPGRG